MEREQASKEFLAVMAVESPGNGPASPDAHEALANLVLSSSGEEVPSPEEQARAHQATLERLLEERGPLTSEEHQFRSTSICAVPVTKGGVKGIFPLRIQSVPEDINAVLHKKTIGAVVPPLKKPFDLKKKAHVPFRDTNDPEYIQARHVAALQYSKLIILYGLDEELSDEHGDVVWRPNEYDEDEESREQKEQLGLAIIDRWKLSAPQFIVLHQAIENLTMEEKQVQVDEELDDF